MSAPAAPGVLVVGLGNRFRSDDAAGLEVARRLAAAGLPEGVVVLEHEGEPVDLLERLADAGAVVVVDAASSGAPAGTVHRLDPIATPLPAALFGVSTHALGLGETVELARALGRLPGRLDVYAIEGERFAAGVGLSAAVETAVVAVVAELRGGLSARGAPPRGPAPAARRAPSRGT